MDNFFRQQQGHSVAATENIMFEMLYIFYLDYRRKKVSFAMFASIVREQKAFFTRANKHFCSLYED